MSCFKPCTDHKGNTFKSVKEKCIYWGISANTYRNRKRLGWSEKEALETKIKDKEKLCTDHKGNVFDSIKEKCIYWGISALVYHNRKELGWSEKDALETKIKKDRGSSKPCTDHNGRPFKSIAKKCEYYGIPVHIYHIRKKRGWSEKDALEIKIINGNPKPCTDHDGRPFKSVIEKCEYYGIPAGIYHARKRIGWSEEEALGIVPHFPISTRSNHQLTDNLYIVSYKDGYCNCIYNGNSIILHEDIVKNICRKYNEDRILKKGEKYA